MEIIKILHDELTDTMSEEIGGTLLEDFILDAIKKYHQQKTKELVEEQNLNIDIFKEWLDGAIELAATEERKLIYERVMKKANQYLTKLKEDLNE